MERKNEKNPDEIISLMRGNDVYKKLIGSVILFISTMALSITKGCATNSQDFNANLQQQAPETTAFNYNFWEYTTMCFSHLNQLEGELSKMNHVTEEQEIALSSFREVLIATMTLQQQILQNNIEYLQTGGQHREFLDNRLHFVPENTSGKLHLLVLEIYQFIESANWQLNNFQGLNPVEKNQLLEKLASLKNACLLLMERLN